MDSTEQKPAEQSVPPTSTEEASQPAAQVKENGEGQTPTPSAQTETPESEDGKEVVKGAFPGTVFADPTNFSIKHPLQNSWTMWYDNPRKKTSQDTWGNFLKQIVTFDTVEDFWRLYNNVVPASQLEHGSNYHLFKYGIEPKWEDPANDKGGQWVFTHPLKLRKEKLDELWLYTLLACVGETFGDEEDEVCGCVISMRKTGDRIALWTRTATKEAATRAIGAQFKRTLGLPPNVILGYQSHADSMRRTGSAGPRHRYEV